MDLNVTNSHLGCCDDPAVCEQFQPVLGFFDLFEAIADLRTCFENALM